MVHSGVCSISERRRGPQTSRGPGLLTPYPTLSMGLTVRTMLASEMWLTLDTNIVIPTSTRSPIDSSAKLYY